MDNLNYIIIDGLLRLDNNGRIIKRDFYVNFGAFLRFYCFKIDGVGVVDERLVDFEVVKGFFVII